jgi:internalin A
VPVAELARLTELERLKAVLLPEDLPEIAKLHGLEELRIELNADQKQSQAMRPYDLSPLAAMPKLQRLAILSHLVTDLHQVAALPRLTALSVAGCTKVKDLAPLAGLSQLEHLDVFLTSVTDLSPVAKLDLTSLNVGHTPVRSIAPLASMKELRALNLAGTDVRDLAPLASLSGLESLDLTSALVTDAQVIASLASLRRLLVGYIEGVPVNALGKLGELEVLYLDGLGLEDVTALASLRKLRELSLLDNPKLTDISPIAKLPALEVLHLTLTGVAKAERDALRKARPSLRVIPY